MSVFKIQNSNCEEANIVEREGFKVEGIYDCPVFLQVNEVLIKVVLGNYYITMNKELYKKTEHLIPTLESFDDNDQISTMRDVSFMHENQVVFVVGAKLFIVNTETSSTAKVDAGLLHLFKIAMENDNNNSEGTFIYGIN